jgi:DNA-binding beta-propeller fold protein YncE
MIRSWDGANVATYAGSGTRGLLNGYRTSAQFGAPVKAAWDASGNMYVTDTDNFVVRKIDAAGNVTTFAGTGQEGLVNGPGSQAQFRFPTGIVFNPADNYLYVADAHNNVIRRIDLAGNVSTYAGTGTGGLTNGARSQAQFMGPTNLVIFSGSMFISDTLNNVIRRIDMSTGTVYTYIS